MGKEPFWFYITKESALIDFHLPEHFAQVFLCHESLQTNGCILKMTPSSASTIKLISIPNRPALPQKFYWDFCNRWKDTNTILLNSRELLLSLFLSLPAAALPLPGLGSAAFQRILFSTNDQKGILQGLGYSQHSAIHSSFPPARQSWVSSKAFNNSREHFPQREGPRWV